MQTVRLLTEGRKGDVTEGRLKLGGSTAMQGCVGVWGLLCRRAQQPGPAKAVSAGTETNTELEHFQPLDQPDQVIAAHVRVSKSYLAVPLAQRHDAVIANARFLRSLENGDAPPAGKWSVIPGSTRSSIRVPWCPSPTADDVVSFEIFDSNYNRPLPCADHSAWSSIPTDLLLAELSRRDDTTSRPECGSGNKGSYDTGIHVFALFLILTLSTLGMTQTEPYSPCSAC